MFSHLKYISGEYDQVPDSRGVSPMSGDDCDIIMELVSIATLRGDAKLISILEKWKKISDTKVQRLLSEYKDMIEAHVEGDVTVLPEREEFEGPTTYFVQIKDEYFKVKDIFRIGSGERYEERTIYSILLNNTSDGVTIKGSNLANISIDFYSKDQRDKELARVIGVMTEFGKIEFK